ncbi:uncharacterized protein LOC122818778 [Drosophila biarmipes]|uniref:uncharacterized protein LOC122818778 n=1 Tax=Drosophila biarmipes TaxID=125945 RepID=UPI001CDAF6F1|nr:uncharacterized protein LOC122818778 [Drosophila biarmipes]XP_050745956.1 uncharacterized protein LOC122818778 [Drosophila biarmipes]XP_050745957.1 uncharacterized protein LOC122818778 [Drosophila biarmipes]XP_050745958.1 uncharacterized protein LOC122818778 [Drosophila biarmipes]
MLSEVEDLAFTCDAVTIPKSSRSFLTITAHFLYQESLNSICLKSTRMEQISDVEQINNFKDFKCFHNKSIGNDSDESENMELKLYFSLPKAASESNPLEIWKSHKATMAGLYKLAMKYLITLECSAPSERLASAIKCVVCDSRRRMTDAPNG